MELLPIMHKTTCIRVLQCRTRRFFQARIHTAALHPPTPSSPSSLFTEFHHGALEKHGIQINTTQRGQRVLTRFVSETQTGAADPKRAGSFGERPAARAKGHHVQLGSMRVNESVKLSASVCLGLE